MSAPKIYDVVTIKALRKPIDFRPDGTSSRAPQVGDTATIVEVYQNPPGYELECNGSDGITTWLWAFAPEDVELVVADDDDR